VDVASRAENFDPIVVPIEDREGPTMTLHEWYERVRSSGPVDLGVSAAEILREARSAGEV
jgi:hypothetical protein